MIIDAKLRLNEQTQINQRMERQVSELARENEKMKQKVKNLKEEKSIINLIKETNVKETEFRKQKGNEYPYFVDETRLRGLEDDLNKMRLENKDLKEKVVFFKELTVKKKKAILNEICNLVNTKNSFETTVAGEFSRNEEVTVIVNEREDFYKS